MSAGLGQGCHIMVRPFAVVALHHLISLVRDLGVLLPDQPAQKVVWEKPAVEGLDVLKLGTKDQPALARKGDDLRIDWGYLYVAVTAQQQAQKGPA